MENNKKTVATNALISGGITAACTVVASVGGFLAQVLISKAIAKREAKKAAQNENHD